MKIAIVGFDTEGRASYDYFSKQPNNTFTICDQKIDIDIPDGAVSQLGENYLDNLDGFDLIIRTAGLHPQKILDKNPGVKDKITTHVNEFLKVCPTKNTFGITGTKGKGTTSTLLTEMLKADGKDAYLGGNIGLPPFKFIDRLTAESCVVLELSSFQLIDIQKSPHIATCLMVVPEHLDWHKDLDEYFSAKAQLFKVQNPEDLAIYYADNDISKQIACSGPAKKITYYQQPGAVIKNENIQIGDQTICKTSEVKLLGEHNLQNVCAALTAFLQVSQNTDAARKVITTFAGLPHRLEFVRELNGVKYYNDSFGTTPETAIAAIKSFEKPMILIVGGSDKGVDYNDLVTNIFNENIKHVICIGTTGNKIADILENRKNEKTVTYTVWQNATEIEMSQIVATAYELAKPGEIVLLSTGSASFDMFKNYKDRGEQFVKAVQELS